MIEEAAEAGKDGSPFGKIKDPSRWTDDKDFAAPYGVLLTQYIKRITRFLLVITNNATMLCLW